MLEGNRSQTHLAPSFTVKMKDPPGVWTVVTDEKLNFMEKLNFSPQRERVKHTDPFSMKKPSDLSNVFTISMGNT